MNNVLVVGSVNMDVVNHVGRHPLPGETIYSHGTDYQPGGKGANQAVAASLAGARVTILAAVGDDPFGGVLTASLRDRRVHTDAVLVKPGSSGLAFITVNEAGENHIVLSPGANGQLTVEDLAGAELLFGAADALLVQNEIPWETTCRAVAWARARGARVYLNPAPARELDADILRQVDVLVVNETEAERVSGVAVSGIESADAAAQGMLALGAGAVLVTLGAAGSLYTDAAGRRLHTPAFPVPVRDTTAAGDTFIGALAAAYTGQNAESALRFASAAAAIAVSRPGAQVSVPTQEQIERFLAQ